MEEILDIIIKLVASLLAIGGAWLVKWLVNLLKSQLDEKETAKLNMFIGELVAAAEQMYRDDDWDGSVRLDYVQGMLIQAGYEMTEAVRALIEAKVFEINVVSRSGGEEE